MLEGLGERDRERRGHLPLQPCRRTARACLSGTYASSDARTLRTGLHQIKFLGAPRHDATTTETCFQFHTGGNRTRRYGRRAFSRFWKEVQWLEDHPRHATSLLLMTNPYWASNFDAFEQFGDALNASPPIGNGVQGRRARLRGPDPARVLSSSVCVRVEIKVMLRRVWKSVFDVDAIDMAPARCA